MRTGMVFLIAVIFGAGSFSIAQTRCSTEDLEPGQELIVSLMSAPVVPKKFTVVDTVFHVISKEGVSEDIIQKQIKVINDAYRPSGFQFNLQEVNHVKDDSTVERFESANDNTFAGRETFNNIKSELRRGEAGVLNVYFGKMLSGFLGFATFPWEQEDAPLIDGVVVSIDSLPEGSNSSFNLGHTLTHEIGHWMGLYHTFQDGCSEGNDLIDDTPAHRWPTSGCPEVEVSSCPGVNQSIPVSNFMNYSDDACMNEFTPLQMERVNTTFYTYRRSVEITQF